MRHAKSLACGAILAAGLMAANADDFIPADDQRLEYSDYAVLEFVNDPAFPGQKLARLQRPLNSPGKGYNWDNPGARLRFATDAAAVTVRLHYNDKHISTSARNPVGLYYIDGRSADGWKFSTAAKTTLRKPETVEMKLPSPGDGKAHDYELVMPYGDSVDVVGVAVTDKAKFHPPKPRPSLRCAIYGDSITHGFTASHIGNTYAFKVAQLKNWQLVDLGIGGRAATAEDGTVVGKIACDRLVVLIGVNDWQGGRPVALYKQNIRQFIANFRKSQPKTPVTFITPLWVSPSWKPAAAKSGLEDYRQALRDAVREIADPAISLVEGPELIDHDAKFFDPVAVHPNDAGFEIMARRLAEKL